MEWGWRCPYAKFSVQSSYSKIFIMRTHTSLCVNLIQYPKSQCLVRSVKAIVFLALLALASLVIIITFDVVTIKYMLLCMLAFISFGCVVLQLVSYLVPLVLFWI